MKYRILFKFLISLFTVLGFSQNNSNVELPKITPPNVEAASLGKFVETPVSLQSGIPSISIPLYNLEYAGMSVPVSINYHSGGIKVNEVASSVGLGWSLSANGSISRQVRDKPDQEGSRGYINNPEVTNFNPNTYNHSDGDLYDYEPDVFVFNFPGKSGSFYFSQITGQPILHELDDLKIEKVVENNNYVAWVITDSNGIQYYFGKNKDQTKIATSQVTSDGSVTYDHLTGDYINPPFGSSSSYVDTWYLLEIYNPNTTRKIDFNYDFNYGERELGISGTSYINNPISNGITAAPGGSVFTSTTGFPPTEAFKSITTQFYNRGIGGRRVLQSITAGDYSVHFIPDTQNREDLQNAKKLNGVKVYHKTELIKDYEFEHYYTTSNQVSNWNFGNLAYRTKRLFLGKLYDRPINSSSTDIIPPYQFTYNTTHKLPDRFSASTDFWGYYNNKNPYLLLDLPSFHLDLPVNTQIPNAPKKLFIKGADRSVHREAAKAGILTQIINPKGGITQFEYENNIAKKINSDGGQHSTPIEIIETHDNTFLTGNWSAYSLENSLFHNPLEGKGVGMYENEMYLDPTYTIPNSSRYITDFTISERVYGNAKISTQILGCDTPDFYNDTNCYFSIIIKGISDPNFNISISDPSFERLLPPGTYRIEAIRARPHQSTGDPFEIIQDFNISILWNETEDIDYSLVGGLRIKEIKYIDPISNKQIKKKYSYVIENTNDTSGELFQLPINKSEVIGTALNFVYMGGMNGSFPTNAKVIEVSSNSLSPMGSYAGSSVLYTNVKEEYIDESNQKEAGYTFYEFFSSPIIGDHKFPFAPVTQYDWKHGKPSKTKWFKKNGASYTLVKEQLFEYEVVTGWSSKGLAVGYLPGIIFHHNPPSGAPYTAPLNNADKDLGTNLYSPVHSTFRLTKEREINYHANGNAISEKVIEYSPSGINLTSLSKATNSQNQILETKYFYPQDIEMAGKPHVQDLINQHKIGTPLVTQSFRNTAKSSEQETLYKDWGNGIIAPEIIKTAKGAATAEVRIKYNALDNTTGNPLEVQQEGGQSITYIWGYNKTLPIAKIENATYAQVQPYEANLQTHSNGTDEASLITALNSLRTVLPNAMITTYTHKPLIGVSTMTDSKGNFVRYHYDTFNRLKFVTDKDDKIVSENKYHYKN